jgi:hypothetical protein
MSRFTKIKKEISGKTADGSKPTNPKLYAQVKSEAKKKFDRWPSAYSSAWLVKNYKARGGKYS